MFLWLKCIYQTIRISLTLKYYAWLTPKTDPIKLAIQNRKNRFAKWIPGAPLKVFAIFAIHNWEKELLTALPDIGEVTHFTWTEGQDFFPNRNEWKTFQSNLNKRLLCEFTRVYREDENILIFLYTSDFVIAKETLNKLRRPNTFVISFCWDDLLYFKGLNKGQPVGVSEISQLADINLTLSPEAISRYHYQKSPCIFWNSKNMGGPGQKILTEHKESSFYVLFIGTKYGWREKFIQGLIAKGVKLICYGKGWENGTLSNEEMKMAIQIAPITLGFANVGYTRSITTIKGRDFEVPVFGGLLLTQYSEGINLYYEADREILVYRNMEECYEKIQKVKRNKEWALQIRNAGYEKANHSCTWEARAAYLEEVIQEITKPE